MIEFNEELMLWNGISILLQRILVVSDFDIETVEFAAFLIAACQYW